MTILFIILATISLGIILHATNIYYKKYKKNISIRKSNSNKIKNITDKINNLLSNRTKQIYYIDLKTEIDTTISNTHRINNTKNNTKKLIDIDNIYCNLKRDLRVIDEFNEFNEKFTYRKRKYRMTFNKSMNIINLLEDKYNKNIVDKYLINFDIDFSNIKVNEVNEINKLNKNCINLYNSYSIYELTKSFNEIKRIDCELLTKLNEPNRLRDKFISSEDNIEQLEEELSNTKGSLYHKVFNIIKYNKVPKENIDEWNIIRKNINIFKKSKLLNYDIIELNNKLNSIIKKLSDLNNTISLSVKVKKISEIKIK